MVGSKNNFDPELLHARWLLGGVGPDELTNQAEVALTQGFDGPALRQLAGLIRPALHNLDTLPDRAFLEMGLEPLDKEQAVNLMLARGMPSVSGTIAVLVETFPSFSKRWRQHVALWAGEPGGGRNHLAELAVMAQFVVFVVEDLYEKGELDETRRVFECFEALLVQGNEEDRDFIGVAFFETLLAFTASRPNGSTAFEHFLGPMSQQVWKANQRIWRGKSNLMDVITS